MYVSSKTNVNLNVFMFIETWYSNSTDYLVRPDYDHFVLNRPKERGGGVAMLVKTL